VVASYRDPDRAAGLERLKATIEAIAAGVPSGLAEIKKLATTMKRRAGDILAYFQRPGTSNGPTEAINGRLEHLRGSALGPATSPTTSPARSSKPADSDQPHTLVSDEPLNAKYWFSEFHGEADGRPTSRAGAMSTTSLNQTAPPVCCPGGRRPPGL